MSGKTYRDPSVTKYDFTQDDLRSLYSIVSYGARHATTKGEAIWYFDRRITYGEFMEDVDAIAAGLVIQGVKKGDYVTIFLPNIPQCVMAVYSVNRIGAICNLVHPLSTRTELEHAIHLTGSRFIMAFEGNEGICEGLGAKVIRCRIPTFFPTNIKGKAMRIGFKLLKYREAKKASNAVEWTAVLKSGKNFIKHGGELPEDTVKPEDTAAIMYTGGTTGVSKGVMLSNYAINASSTDMMLLKFNDRPHIGMAFLSFLPVFHAFGFCMVIHQPLCGGMRLILMPEFDAKQCANIILKERVDTVPAVPPMFERMYPYLRHEDVSFISYIASGGDRVAPELAAKYNEFMSVKFLPGYGLTESCGCCVLTDSVYDTLPEGCVGKPLPKTQICLVEPGTTTVIPNTEEGELCLRCPGLMKGYLNNEEATAEVMKIHEDGLTWLHTGDLVTIDSESGYIIFRSRYKRMIKVNGFNVYPTMVETSMGSCPLIKEVCAVGMPWKTDERIKLFVTLNDPTMNLEEAVVEIRKYAEEHLNRWSIPKKISILDEMPRTKLNKIDYVYLQQKGN
ncbi:MAG TPA: class I adenylate-forming enzyme family protein [Methanocorpusculum sp.]|nr:class I adenylate-forming enzyme family protein [Methanocorpusculum sp.]HJJ39733.1 class I adenylate-forming enzyme family protein [Methanocorpusculum sp.]HJJ49342.1 class I adenylate-forming enzyme family protein [Methanocorpusculum sp.]HJJ56614.1 class I adenylate-forming enzyme family protein [Methanocorpusculum sp.]